MGSSLSAEKGEEENDRETNKTESKENDGEMNKTMKKNMIDMNLWKKKLEERLEVIIIGKLRAGKSSIMHRLCDDTFQERYKPSFGFVSLSHSIIFCHSSFFMLLDAQTRLSLSLIFFFFFSSTQEYLPASFDSYR